MAGLLLPAVFLGLTRTSAPTTLIAGWYVALTALMLALAYWGRGLRRWAGLLIVVGYGGFVVAVLLSE